MWGEAYSGFAVISEPTDVLARGRIAKGDLHDVSHAESIDGTTAHVTGESTTTSALQFHDPQLGSVCDTIVINTWMSHAGWSKHLKVVLMGTSQAARDYSTWAVLIYGGFRP